MDGRWDEARTAMARAIRYDTEDARLQFHAGMIALHFGDRTEAREPVVERALALNPQFHPAYSGQARADLATCADPVERSLVVAFTGETGNRAVLPRPRIFGCVVDVQRLHEGGLAALLAILRLTIRKHYVMEASPHATDRSRNVTRWSTAACGPLLRGRDLGRGPGGPKTQALNLSSPLLAQAAPTPKPTLRPASPTRAMAAASTSPASTIRRSQRATRSTSSRGRPRPAFTAHITSAGTSHRRNLPVRVPVLGRVQHAGLACGGPDCVNPNLQIPGQGTNPDDTLPGFIVNTLYETYLQYQDPKLYVKLGDQVINTPWAPAADTRLKPSAFRGGDACFTSATSGTSRSWTCTNSKAEPSRTFEHDAVDRDEDRFSELRRDADQLRQAPYTSVPTAGFTYGRVGYQAGQLGANGYYYDFADIAQAFWLEAKYNSHARTNPSLSVQMGTEAIPERRCSGRSTARYSASRQRSHPPARSTPSSASTSFPTSRRT